MKHTTFFLLLLCPVIALSQDGWVKQISPNQDAYYLSVAMLDQQRAIAVGTDGEYVSTNDGGTNWIQKNIGTREKLTRVRFLNQNVGFISGLNGTLLKTANGGGTWTPINTGLTKAIYDVLFQDEQNGMISSEAGVLLQTTNGGGSWIQRNARFGPNDVNTIALADKQTIVVAGNAGNISRSTNGGASWDNISNPATFSLYSVSFGSPNSGTAVGTNGMILHSADAGRTWSVQYADVPLSQVALQEVQHLDSANAYIVGSAGIILRTTNAGLNWVPQDNPSQQPFTGVSFINPFIGTVVGRNGAIIRTSTGGMLAAYDLSTVLPFTAAPVYPNPTGSSAARLPITVSSRTHGRLLVFNPLGQMVYREQLAELSPGEHTLTFPVDGLKNGSYIYQLETSSGVHRGTFVVTR